MKYINILTCDNCPYRDVDWCTFGGNLIDQAKINDGEFIPTTCKLPDCKSGGGSDFPTVKDETKQPDWYCCLADYPNHTDSCPNNPKNMKGVPQ